jgi:hypothetical protein
MYSSPRHWRVALVKGLMCLDFFSRRHVQFGSAQGTETTRNEWLSDIPKDAKWGKVDDAFSFAISRFFHRFPSSSRSFLRFLEICVKQGTKCWQIIPTVFIWTYTFSSYVSLSLSLSASFLSVSYSECIPLTTRLRQAGLRGITEPLWRSLRGWL